MYVDAKKFESEESTLCFLNQARVVYPNMKSLTLCNIHLLDGKVKLIKIVIGNPGIDVSNIVNQVMKKVRHGMIFYETNKSSLENAMVERKIWTIFNKDLLEEWLRRAQNDPIWK